MGGPEEKTIEELSLGKQNQSRGKGGKVLEDEDTLLKEKTFR